MENRIWEANLEALEEMLPGWGKFFEKEEYKLAYEEEDHFVKGAEFEIEASYGGEKVTVVRRNEQNYYLAGKYDPLRMAERQAKKYKDLDYGAALLVIGFSDGRVLRRLSQTIGKDAILVVYEPCMDLFLHTMHHYDLTDLFAERKSGLIIEGINGQELESVLGKIITLERMTKIKTLVLGNYENIFPEEVRHVIGLQKEKVKALRTHWNTVLSFMGQSIFNVLSNMKYLYWHYSFGALHFKLKENVPVILVAAGPSLDKNIELLKEAKGKACIIACDTALKPLVKRDIIPDFFVIVDPKKPMELFEDERIFQIPLISGLNVPHDVMARHCGEKILYIDEGCMQWILSNIITENTQDKFMGIVPTGGSVATSAFSIGRLMGAKNIILVGQDLALSGEKEHAEGTFQKDRKFNVSSGKFPMVEGIDGSQLPTLHNLKLYLEWFEKQILTWKNVHVVDATEGGALIHGSEVMTLREAIDTYCIGEFSSEELLKSCDRHFSEEERERALSFYKSIPEQLERLEKRILQGKKLYLRLEKLAKKENYSVQELKKLLKKIKKLNTYLDRDPLALLLTEAVKGVEYTLRTTIYQIEDEERKELIESARVGGCFLQALEGAVYATRPYFEKLAEFDGSYAETDTEPAQNDLGKNDKRDFIGEETDVKQ